MFQTTNQFMFSSCSLPQGPKAKLLHIHLPRRARGCLDGLEEIARDPGGWPIWTNNQKYGFLHGSLLIYQISVDIIEVIKNSIYYNDLEGHKNSLGISKRLAKWGKSALVFMILRWKMMKIHLFHNYVICCSPESIARARKKSCRLPSFPSLPTSSSTSNLQFRPHWRSRLTKTPGVLPWKSSRRKPEAFHSNSWIPQLCWMFNVMEYRKLNENWGYPVMTKRKPPCEISLLKE